MADDLVSVRNKTGEARWFASVGEEGYPVNRIVEDDEVLDLPQHLADRLAEQPGWELVGELAKPKKAAVAAKDKE